MKKSISDIQVDEVVKKQLKKEDPSIIQRSIQVPKDIWSAADYIPEGRTQFIIDCLANRIAADKSELPKLRLEVEEHKSELRKIESMISAKEKRITELEGVQENEVQEAVRLQNNIEQAVVGTQNLLKEFRKNLSKAHFKRLSDLSGTPVSEIESFIKEHKYRPTEIEIREFFLR